MDIRPLDLEDDAEFGRFHQVMESAERFERPAAAMWSLDEARVTFREQQPGERALALVAIESGELVGAGAAFLPTADNLHVDWLMPWVPPEGRRRGIGSAVLGELVALCRSDGRTDHIIETAYPFARRDDHPYRRFCERHGFTLANTEIRRHLDLPLDTGMLEALVAESAAHHPGYSIESFSGPIPDELLPSLCETKNLLAVDAPQGALQFEPERMDPEMFRQREALLVRQGRTKVSTLAVSDAVEVVAFNDLVIPAGDRPNVYQWGTLVREAHRGARLGMAVKARGLLTLQEIVGPDRTRVMTCNAEQNAHMVSINERLGFRPVEVAPSFLLRDAR